MDDQEDNSIWVRVNEGEWIKWNQIGFPNDDPDWVWDQVGEWTSGDTADPLTFELPAGINTIDFAHREPDLPFDKIHLTLETAEPFGVGEVASNCVVDCAGTPGAPCDDGNACTTNDVLDADCNCAGVVADSDGDGVCDADDQCPGSDDGQDADNDGLPDGCDDCDATLAGTPCDDGDPQTSNDRYTADCECAGEPVTATDDDYWLEAECADYGAQWLALSDPEASAQIFLRSQPEISSHSDPPTDPDFHIAFTVSIASPGTYRIYARTAASSGDNDSFWVQVNNGGWIQWNKINYPYDNTGWVWEQVGEWEGGNNVTPLTFELVSGINTVTFAYREPDTQLDKLLITPAAEAPVGTGGLAENCSNCPDEPCDDSQARAAADLARPEPARAESLATAPGRLYPNPALNRITLTDVSEPIRNLTLFDAWGRSQRRFADEEALSRTLDVSGLPKGVYYLRGQVGAQVGMWRFVLQ